METVLPEYAGLVKSSHRAATEALEPSIQTDALSSRVSEIRKWGGDTQDTGDK